MPQELLQVGLEVIVPCLCVLRVITIHIAQIYLKLQAAKVAIAALTAEIALPLTYVLAQQAGQAMIVKLQFVK
jgi:predicted amino acid dehydrogenase